MVLKKKKKKISKLGVDADQAKNKKLSDIIGWLLIKCKINKLLKLRVDCELGVQQQPRWFLI